MIQTIDFKVGKYLVPVDTVRTHGRIFFKFAYSKTIMDEIKQMAGVQWHGYEGAPFREIPISVFKTDKVWSVLDNHRNNFQLDFLQGKKPYQRWDDFVKSTPNIQFERPLREHQKELVHHGLSVHYGLWAAEMGTGKTLAAIEVMERSGHEDWWYVAPKSALRAVELDFYKWGMKFRPEMMTYEGLVKRMKNWKDGDKAPRGLVGDESQRVKTPSSARSEAMLALANGVRGDWGPEGFVILMSGSPAPKAPTDWWHQCEVAMPGFLREGTINRFRFRLGLHEEKDAAYGGSFHQHVTWLDDERKCAKCGKMEFETCHLEGMEAKTHPFEPSKNEVAGLYRRMKGLVVVKFKKDCLDLPDKIYRVIDCPVLPNTIRAAKLITAGASSTAQALIQLRELSDGFQYSEVQDGDAECPLCFGSAEMDDFTIKPEFAERYNQVGYAGDPEEVLSEEDYREKYFDRVRTTCIKCAGTKRVPTYTRVTNRVPCPKDDVLRDLLDEHDDVGRLVVYAGFEGSVERCVEIALSEKWAVVKWDGKGLKVWNSEGQPLRVKKAESNEPDEPDVVDPLMMFQNDFENHPRVCFIGNAGAAGTGLTLTASPSIFYYSNSFNGDDRIQSEDRIHRIGMDVNRGATIIDVYHLPTDKYVHENLKKKKKLQDLTMGDLQSVFDANAEKENPTLIHVRR